MIDQLFNLIKENSQQAIVNNPEVPDAMNEQAMEIAHHSLVDGLRGFSSEDLAQLQQEVSNNNFNTDSRQIGFLSNSMTDGLMKKLGLNNGIAKTIVLALLPVLLKKVFSGTGSTNPAANNSQSSGFDMSDILGSILGGSSPNSPSGTSSPSGGGIMDQISNIGKSFGLDKDGDGDVDLNDLGSMLKK